MSDSIIWRIIIHISEEGKINMYFKIKESRKRRKKSKIFSKHYFEKMIKFPENSELYRI